ncbi:glycosyltransferase family protein [Mongoliitalea daihaiensis]|uniref:hypothetical protein n=1 Tax=Mongoliitalea daihaiensis TaxID=2782006 RepID=UPI001F2DB2D3|nr:hypothetical protein [Mongoliitalea daihaiensis]UJP64476.1 hypothetical protein IPZ59_16970 [Mongoliitalea daihaiensis]
MCFKIPILLIAFNRPDTTQKVIDSLMSVKPLKIFAAIDAPRPEKGEAEVQKNNQVIEIIKNINWDCDIEFIIPKHNMGCKLNISQAITQIFKKVDRLIVIEDDIIAGPSFFIFADQMLERYKDNPQVGIITANNYTPIDSATDYYFSRYTHIWGWALWKRTWEGFDVDLNFLKGKNVEKILKELNLGSSEMKYMSNYYYNVKTKIDNGVMNAWGPQFFLYNYLNGLLTITPKNNLAMNIGVESSRVDKEGHLDVHFRPVDYDFSVSTHPMKIEVNAVYDKFHFNNHINYKAPIFKRIISKIKRTLLK